jgi:hypothetical protein
VAGKTYEHETAAEPDFEAVMVIRSPATASSGVADMVGVSSFVTLSMNELPESDAVAKSTPVGADGAVLSMLMSRPGPDGEVFPAGSVTVEDIDHEPSDIAGRSQLFTVGEATYVHDTVEPSALRPLITTVLPSGTTPPDMEGVVSFVLLSVFEAPESDAGNRSGAARAEGADVSILIGSGADGGEVFPAGSVVVVVIDQSPSDIVGRSQLETEGDFT